MYGGTAIHIRPRRIMSIGLILTCLTGLLLAQTFHYSRGWTNGKKRTPLLISPDDRREEPQVLGICQMLKLKYIVEQRQHSEANVPHEILDRAEDDLTRQRRNGGIETTSIFDSMPLIET